MKVRARFPVRVDRISLTSLVQCLESVKITAPDDFASPRDSAAVVTLWRAGPGDPATLAAL